jgi:hypothetical protein
VTGGIVRSGKNGFTGDLRPKVQGDKDMKVHSVLKIIAFICCLSVVPAVGHDCCHHGHHCGDCRDSDYDCCHGSQTGRNSGGWARSDEATDLQTVDGKITEIVYLPGATTDSGMVEVRLQSAGQSKLIRLAPLGFLKQSGLLLREGDNVTLKGFAVAGMEDDLIVATEIHKGDKSLPLRDTRGRPMW